MAASLGLRLTRLERRLFDALHARLGEGVLLREIRWHIWGPQEGPFVSNKAIYTLVCRLRQALERESAGFVIDGTRRSEWYRLRRSDDTGADTDRGATS